MDVGDEIYVPENAEDVLLKEGIEISDAWKEKFNQYKDSQACKRTDFGY